MNRLFLLSIILTLTFVTVGAKGKSNATTRMAFGQGKVWRAESESPDYKLFFNGDTVEIIAPKGLTLWYKQKMCGDVVIEYDACVVVHLEQLITKENPSGTDRLSDLNCFWMAQDPKHPDDILKRAKWRGGVFLNCYSLRQYYMGFGGNYNSTTRFRRYDGDEAGITDVAKRPAILTEYTDTAHLLKPNHWYHIKLENRGNRVRYYIDGERLVDFCDAESLREGWFGFRTTLSHTKIANFKYTSQEKAEVNVPLQWIGNVPQQTQTVSFGVPFAKGELKATDVLTLKTNAGEVVKTDTWPLAFWQDGSIKWSGFSAVIPAMTEKLFIAKTSTRKPAPKKRTSPPDTRTPITDNRKSKLDNRNSKIDTRYPTPENRNFSPAPQQSKTEKREGVFQIASGNLSLSIPESGENLLDSIVLNGVKVGENLRLVCSTQNTPVLDDTQQICFTHFSSKVSSATIERKGDVCKVVKIVGKLKEVQNPCRANNDLYADYEDSRTWLPFVVRLYIYEGSEQIKLVHTFIYDGDQNKDFIRSLGIRMDIPLRDELYNRHVAFACADGGVWSEPVKPLVGRRELTTGRQNLQGKKSNVQSFESNVPSTTSNVQSSASNFPSKKSNVQSSFQEQQMQGKRIPPYETFNEKDQQLIDDWAAWDAYRLSQLLPDAFSIRKRANTDNPWIGTFSGSRSSGLAFLGDVSGGMAIGMKDFWQSYPSSIEITGAKTNRATITAWLWSPEAEPMDFRHYDNVAHGLNSSYEDVQEGMSTPFGIARTTTLYLIPQTGYHGKADFAKQAAILDNPNQLIPAPEYLHDKQAFGIWSLPDRSNAFRTKVEDRLDAYINIYKDAIEQHKWYGFWNYGDVMHAYDPVRHSWRYDVGGFAWDNTELASNMWLWYNFLRTGRADIWRMAEAMSRHTAEVDVYHLGDNAGLGSRHNVSHWGCGAKEVRISQAAFNRFLYYLTADDRSGDLMSEVVDADQKLYTLDPMRLAQPREMYPCTAPARLRIGPDWISYAGNWMTEWERTQNTKYRDKIITGMKSLCALPSRLFTGPLALGYDPATGIISTECDSLLQTTNHLATIMGGFEIMNEMMPMIDLPEWNDAWLDYALNYKHKAWELRKSKFRVARLQAYAAYLTRNNNMAREAWNDLFHRLEHTEAPVFKIEKLLPPEVPAPQTECKTITTNDAALWSLDAIYMQEVIPQ